VCESLHSTSGASYNFELQCYEIRTGNLNKLVKYLRSAARTA
jgi:hypothetical protein